MACTGPGFSLLRGQPCQIDLHTALRKHHAQVRRRGTTATGARADKETCCPRALDRTAPSSPTFSSKRTIAQRPQAERTQHKAAPRNQERKAPSRTSLLKRSFATLNKASGRKLRLRFAAWPLKRRAQEEARRQTKERSCEMTSTPQKEAQALLSAMPAATTKPMHHRSLDRESSWKARAKVAEVLRCDALAVVAGRSDARARAIQRPTRGTRLHEVLSALANTRKRQVTTGLRFLLQNCSDRKPLHRAAQQSPWTQKLAATSNLRRSASQV